MFLKFLSDSFFLVEIETNIKINADLPRNYTTLYYGTNEKLDIVNFLILFTLSLTKQKILRETVLDVIVSDTSAYSRMNNLSRVFKIIYDYVI